MNHFAAEYMDYLISRNIDKMTTTSVDDDSTAYTGIHSGLGPPDLSLRQAIDHMKTVPPSQFFNLDPVGWYEGDVAWFMIFPRGIQPDGTLFEMRVTLIARRVEGEWKAVHWHVSEAVDRAAAFGCE